MALTYVNKIIFVEIALDYFWKTSRLILSERYLLVIASPFIVKRGNVFVWRRPQSNHFAYGISSLSMAFSYGRRVRVLIFNQLCLSEKQFFSRWRSDLHFHVTFLLGSISVVTWANIYAHPPNVPSCFPAQIITNQLMGSGLGNCVMKSLCDVITSLFSKRIISG